MKKKTFEQHKKGFKRKYHLKIPGNVQPVPFPVASEASFMTKNNSDSMETSVHKLRT